jgi:3-oxoacyl-[acyl-carrier-protein] synthase III
MLDAYINDFSYVLGDRVSALEATAQRGRLVSSVQTLADGGFVRHHVCSPAATTYDLAKASVETLHSMPKDPGAIIYATCIPANGNVADPEAYQRSKDVKHLMDFPVSHLVADFGFRRANVFGLNQQACTGMLGSLRLAQMLLNCEPETGDILCVTSDRFPSDAIYEQAYCLISDGAAACVVSSRPSGYRILSGHAITNGALAQASDDEIVGSFFTYSVAAIQKCLQKAEISIDQLNWIVPQNTNRKAWQILCSLLHYEFERVQFPTLADVGHVISADCIINLKCLEDQNRIRQNDKVLLFMSGLGLNWQCLLLEKV